MRLGLEPCEAVLEEIAAFRCACAAKQHDKYLQTYRRVSSGQDKLLPFIRMNRKLRFCTELLIFDKIMHYRKAIEAPQVATYSQTQKCLHCIASDCVVPGTAVEAAPGDGWTSATVLTVVSKNVPIPESREAGSVTKVSFRLLLRT